MIRVARISVPGRHKFVPVQIRIEPNHDGSHVVWRVTPQGPGLEHVTGLHSDAGHALAMATAVAGKMIAGKPSKPIVGAVPRLAAKDGRRLPRKPGPEAA